MTCKLKYRYRIPVQCDKPLNENLKSMDPPQRHQVYLLRLWMLCSQHLKNSHELVKKKVSWQNVVMIIHADENPYIIWDFKIGRSDWSQNFMEKAKTMALTCICIQLTIPQFFNHINIKFNIMKSQSKWPCWQ